MFNAAFLVLNGLVLDTKPYRVRIKIAQRASAKGEGTSHLSTREKEKRFRQHAMNALSWLRRRQKVRKK